MSQFIDRRLNGKNKSAVNRQRFIKRFRNQIKKAVTEAISKRSITDIDSGESINIPTKDIKEPRFSYKNGGEREIIFPGNQEFIAGDRIKRPDGASQGKGETASNKGEGVDNFTFEVSREEFLELFFEDLALPDLVKTKIAKIPSIKNVRAGYTTEGVPTNINIIRSMRSAQGRRIALSSPHRRKLREIEQSLSELGETNEDDKKERDALIKRIQELRIKISKVPYIDPFDLRYNNRIKVPKPTTQAVMFCLMDVSGSMDETKKDIAKRFFILLYLFLQRNYEKIELVFIRHHTSAKEVDEQEFFYSRETGGTVVSSALELTANVAEKRYPADDWNIYVAQASDGDNWNADSPFCQELLSKKIMPLVQYYAYVEIMPRHHQSLWEAYLNVKEAYRNFAMQNIDNLSDIYPVFRELFKKDSQLR